MEVFEIETQKWLPRSRGVRRDNFYSHESHIIFLVSIRPSLDLEGENSKFLLFETPLSAKKQQHMGLDQCACWPWLAPSVIIALM